MTVSYRDIDIGSEMPVYVSEPLTRTHLVRYAGASGDFNPLHHDHTFTKMIGLNNVIAHGMLIMGIVGEAIASWIDIKHLRKFSVRFMSMTEPADLDNMESTKGRATIIIKGKVVKIFKDRDENKFECEIIAEDALGSKKLSGSFIAALP